jgi:hypothetical protein
VEGQLGPLLHPSKPIIEGRDGSLVNLAEVCRTAELRCLNLDRE